MSKGHILVVDDEAAIRDLISEVLNYITDNPLKGECLIIVSGFDGQVRDEELEDLDPLEQVEQLIKDGNKPNQAIKKVAKDLGLNRQELYNAYHEV